jgi:hypothetical protein
MSVPTIANYPSESHDARVRLWVRKSAWDD